MEMIELRNGSIETKISSLGACVDSLRYCGKLVGKDGITVGRYANRIFGAKLDICGKSYTLSVNENGHCLHGGAEGFDKKDWKLLDRSNDHALLELVSGDGDQGFPGRLTVQTDFRLENDSLRIIYTAHTDAPTVVNLTNHLYFNLNEDGPAAQHLLMIDADKVLETDDQLIPTGNLLSVRGTRFDHKRQKRFRPDFDCCYALNGLGMRRAAVLKGNRSGITLTVHTDQPGMQLYNTDTHICLETQHFPDSPRHAGFPDTTLMPGTEFKTETIFTLGQEKK